MDVSALVILLVWLIVIGLIFYVLWWGLGQAGLPEPINKVARVLLVVVLVIILIYMLLGILPPIHSIRVK